MFWTLFYRLHDLKVGHIFQTKRLAGLAFALTILEQAYCKVLPKQWSHTSMRRCNVQLLPQQSKWHRKCRMTRKTLLYNSSMQCKEGQICGTAVTCVKYHTAKHDWYALFSPRADQKLQVKKKKKKKRKEKKRQASVHCVGDGFRSLYCYMLLLPVLHMPHHHFLVHILSSGDREVSVDILCMATQKADLLLGASKDTDTSRALYPLILMPPWCDLQSRVHFINACT